MRYEPSSVDGELAVERLRLRAQIDRRSVVELERGARDRLVGSDRERDPGSGGAIDVAAVLVGPRFEAQPLWELVAHVDALDARRPNNRDGVFRRCRSRCPDRVIERARDVLERDDEHTWLVASLHPKVAGLVATRHREGGRESLVDARHPRRDRDRLTLAHFERSRRDFEQQARREEVSGSKVRRAPERRREEHAHRDQRGATGRSTPRPSMHRGGGNDLFEGEGVNSPDSIAREQFAHLDRSVGTRRVIDRGDEHVVEIGRRAFLDESRDLPVSRGDTKWPQGAADDKNCDDRNSGDREDERCAFARNQENRTETSQQNRGRDAGAERPRAQRCPPRPSSPDAGKKRLQLE